MLFASPLDKRAIVFARLLGQAIESVASIGLILLPFANANIALGRPPGWRSIPTLAASGLFGAGLGFALALALNFAFGPRRARVVSQIFASLVGASAVLVAQALAVMPDALRERALRSFLLTARAARRFRRAGRNPRARRARRPLRAVGVAWGRRWRFFRPRRSFGGELSRQAALAAAGAPSAERPGRCAAKIFRPAQRRHAHKRTPAAMARPLADLADHAAGLYTLPIGIVLWRHGGVVGAPGVALGPMLVVIAGQLAGSLAWLALSAEDAPDFLATAPATRGELERAKLAAILMPVALFMAAPLMALTLLAPFGAFAQRSAPPAPRRRARC